MRRNKAEVDKYISSVESSSPSLKEKPIKGFLFAKLYFEAKEYELAKRHVSEYLKVVERDPKAHKFLGQLYEREGDINKAVGCYKRSVDLNPAQRDLVLKVAELLVSKTERDSRAEFWVEKAAKLLPGHPAVFNLKEHLLNQQGQQGWNQLFDLLQAELAVRPGDAHINIKLVQLFSSDGRLEEAVKHCLATEKRGLLRSSLDWYSTVVHTLQEFLAQPSVLSNEKMSQHQQRELLLAHCSLLRLTLPGKGLQPSIQALRSFDSAMQGLKKAEGSVTDDLSEVYVEMRGHLYLHAGTLLLKMAQEGEQQWRAVIDLAALCYLLAYQVPRPKSKMSKGDQSLPQPLELLASDRKSQAGHMLLNLKPETHTFVREVVETVGNRSGQGALFELLFGPLAPAGTSFIGNDDIRSINTQAPEISDLTKWDNGSIQLHGGDLQQLCWLGLQWSLLAQRPALRDWLKQLFPRLNLETSKLDTNTPESICLLDLEVFLCGVVWCSHTQLQERDRISSTGQQPRCLPLPLLRLLFTDRQRDWWDAVYRLIHKRAAPGMSAKLRMTVQHGLSTLRAVEKHGLQPALPIHWAQHLSSAGFGVNSYEYIRRSVHYWKVVLPLLDKIKRRRGIPGPLDPLFIHFPSRDIEIPSVKGFEEEAKIAFATLLDIEGKTEEAIATLETINNISSNWHLARIFQRLSEEAGSGVEETQDRCIMFLRKLRTNLSKIYNANADDMDKLPVSMEEVMDLLNDVKQQLEESGEAIDEEEEDGGPVHSSLQFTKPAASISCVKFAPLTPSPSKSLVSPSKRHLITPKTPPHWAEDQKSLLQMLCQQVESLKNEVHDLRHHSSDSMASPHQRMYGDGYGSESMQEGYPQAQTFHGAPLTVATTQAPSMYYNQSPAYNAGQYLLRTAANVTPTKAPVYGINRLPPQQHMYAYQQPTNTPPLQSTPACIYPPQDQVFGAPLRFESPATSLLSPYSEEYYGHSQPTTNPPLPEPGYFTKPSIIPVQPPKSIEGKPVGFGKISFGQPIPAEPPKLPSFGTGIVAQSTPSSAAFKFNSNFKSNDGDLTFKSKNSESLLGLLTSDIPTKSEGPSEGKPQEPPSLGGIFTFGTKNASGFSFADTIQIQDKPNLFGKIDQPFSFTEVTKPVFGLANTAEEEKGAESNNDSTHVEEDEDGPHFEPIVPLPDKVDVKTGEEEEEEMFCNRAKLFRFDAETKEWKERGIGLVKILKHSSSGKVRLLMRREQVLKICANHYITPDMLLKPNAGSDKSWVWNAVDYADEEPRPEQLAIRYKTEEEALLFKTKFEEAQKIVPKSPEKQQEQSYRKNNYPKPLATNFAAQFAKKYGEWDCDVCCVRNAAKVMQCVACQTDNPNVPSKPDSAPATDIKGFTSGPASVGGFTFGFGADSSKDTSSAGSIGKGFGSFGAQIPSSFTFGTSGTTYIPAAGFGAQFGKRQETTNVAAESKPSTMPFGSGFGVQFSKKPGQWDCDTCAVRNEASANSCLSCQTPNPSGKPAAGAPTLATLSIGSGFGAQFGKKTGQWECDTCVVRNEESASSCVSCQTPNPVAKTVVIGAAVSKPSTMPFGAPALATLSTASGFGAQFSKKLGQWDCDTCAVRNEASANSCLSCQTPNPSGKPAAGAPTLATLSIGSGFGAQFGKKTGQWECDTCVVRNEESASSCVSCQTPNPVAKTVVIGAAVSKPSTMPFGAPALATLSTASGFGAQFSKKLGQWDCDTCAVRNEASANSCLSCQTPNPSGKPAAGAPTLATLSIGSGFGAQFGKKTGQWECDTCVVRNEESASSCVSCQTPNPVAKTVVIGAAVSKPSTMPFGAPALATLSTGSGFGAQFSKKLGQWDCDACAVRNEASANSCLSCQTPNPSGKPAAGPPTLATLSIGSGFGAQFGKKPGQWESDTCGVRNEESASSCLSCQTPNPSAKSTVEVAPITKPTVSGFGAHFSKKDGQWDCDACLVRNDASASMCVSCQTPNPNASSSSLGAMFARQEGQWDCDTCLVRNDNSASQCVSCQTPNPNVKSTATAATSSSSFSFKFETPPQAESSTPSAAGFSFTMPIPAGGFKFGTQDTAKETLPAETQTPASGSASMFLKNIAEQHRGKEKESGVSVYASAPSVDKTGQNENPLFTGKPNDFSFADLAKNSQGDFQFGETDSNFKGFTRAGEQLFTSLQSNQRADTSADQDEEDIYKTEENDDIQFEPVVQMPEKVDLVTGEEDEQALYSQRVKLFRFDGDISQWKERGVGILKFLKNATNGRLRVLMRREQVLKVCANHWITTTMNLKPLAGSDKAWMWLANDFSDGDARLEQLAAKFKTPELAEEFKLKFEECQRLLLDIPLQTPHKLVDTGRTAHLIQKAEEMKSGLKDLKSFLTDDKTKIKEDNSQANITTASNTSDLIIKPHAESTVPTLEWDNYDLREEALDDSADTSVYASPLASSPIRKNLFCFGESTAGFNFSFQPVVSPTKSPAKMNQSGVSVDEEQDISQEEERDGLYFEPVVPLPDLVEISTGEENENVCFSHRAKLYRYDKDLNQWKERGIGDLKILQNYDTKRVRLIMRRDQVLKICANHWVTSSMKLEPMKGAEKAWVWSAIDFAEVAKGNVEQLAVRFKLKDVANSFRDVFDQAKTAQENEILVTPIASSETLPQEEAIATGTTVCGQDAVAILEETTTERTEPNHETLHTPDCKSSTGTPHSPLNPSRMVMSPPKFLFGSDSLQKFFGSSPPSSKEDGSSESSKVKDSGWTSQPLTALKISEKAPSQAEADGEVEVVYVRQPTEEQAHLASELLLPLTFFCYQNEPGYTSDDQTDDEDFETTVKALNGKLYQDPPKRKAAGSADQAEAGVEGLDPEVEVVWEKSPTPEEEQKARNLQLPSTFFCGVGSDSEAEKDKPEDFETEVRKAQEALDPERSSEAVSSSTGDAVPEQQVHDQSPSSQEQASDQSEAEVQSTTAEKHVPVQSLAIHEVEVQSSTAEAHVPDQTLTIQEVKIPTPGRQEQATEQSVTIQEAEVQSSTAEEHVPDQSLSIQEVEVSAPGSQEQATEQSVTIQEADIQSSTADEQVPLQSLTIQEAEVQSTTEEQQTPDQSDSTSTLSQTAVSSSREQATTPNPSEKPDASAPALVTPSFGFGFGAQFGKKPGQWECDTCLVRNEESASSCVSCQTLNPAASSGNQAPDQSDSTPAATSSSPIDLSAKKTSEPDSTTTFTTTTTQDFPNSFGSLGFSALGGEGFSFADLAQNTGGEFAFGKQDSNFSWANAGATLFGAAAPAKDEGGEEGSDEEDTNNVGIDFEPIVSLPEVETKSGEEDEEILFKERTKLYRWERDLGQWKERGVGDIKILFHPDKRFYRVLMRREQVLKVCANHTICQSMELKPMNTSNQALVWTATDFSEGEGKVEQLAAKFKTAELAECFRKTFCECQSRMSQSEASALSSPQMSRVQEHSRDANPQVYLSISADDEPLGTVTIELFSHIVPKTAENFRALCTGQKGFGLHNSFFHRVIPDFMCQGGDITNQDGTGGKSIYGDKFEDENFDVRHTGPGLLSMANQGRDTNNSQFFITLKKAEHLDFKHVAFGFVREGMDVVRSMGELGTKTGKPSKKIVITECGQL